ncbi:MULTISPECIES: hypothetical protein [Bradyrhizobium]|jgi:hypothetical protein|uniref:Uncharacterized protein n=1 Tax=Bradyrhizobium brasilense TaxID=1419277 RepID=A0ABY8JHY0_9BRAD|nr:MULTISPECIES: hypothetical protein [Bradyrhizobium]MCA1398272.1 hypothetical protein [Bradyrhizobium sp. BRP56]MCC8946667.1 hypothetical protein [Bradyrhizobium brasilense]MCP1841646.1 hypothetical protein [Bradyrhizobium sp. USDA 4538]MCP1848743.1 hypothetical protein [Bradyrhizobium sp. USDA 4541]MCP1902210.1 hypothetical protein [Bradyrhizobium sp. USDA 4537]
MKRWSGTAGFDGRPAPVASSRLTNAIAASLALGALTLCLVVAVTVLSSNITMATAIPA